MSRSSSELSGESDYESERESDDNSSVVSYDSEWSVGSDDSDLPPLDDKLEEEREIYLKSHELWLEEALKHKLSITISEPIKEGTYLQPYVTYLVSTLPEGWGVRRRYSDFEYLLLGLIQRYPAMIFEDLPPKKIMGNTGVDFVEVRMRGLENFINKLSDNPYIQRDNLFLDFLKLSAQEWSDFRHSNGKIVKLSVGSVMKSKSIFSGFTNLLRKVPKEIEDKRPNEGLLRWHKLLMNISIPENVDIKIREFGDRISESIALVNTMIEILKNMVVSGTNYGLMGKQLYASLKCYNTINKEIDLVGLKVKNEIINDHKKYTKYLEIFSKTSDAWQQLEFFSPQEIIPEIQYEFEDELIHLKGLLELLDRRKIYSERYKEMWQCKDDKEFEVYKLKQSGEKSRKLAKMIAEVRRLKRLTHLTKFEWILINKAIIHCELEKFIKFRNNGFKKMIGLVGRLQTALAIRNELTWLEFLKMVNEGSGSKEMREARIRLANACDFIDYIPSDESEEEEEKEKSENEKIRKESEAAVKVDPSEYDL